MAYRVVVDKPQRVRALASSANIVVADAQLAKTQVSVTQPAYAVTASSRVVNAFTAYSAPVTEINYQNLSAINVALDPYALNQYLRFELGISDAQAMFVTKAFNDLVGAADQTDLQVSKGIADSFGMGDNAVVLLQIIRDFADSTSVIDSQVFSLGLIKSETLGIADTAALFISRFESDVTNISEQAVVGTSKPLADSASMADQFTRSAIYQRSFSDAFVLDDFTDVDALTKDSTAAKGNVIGFSDIQSLVTEKALQDSATVSETFRKDVTYNRTFSDAVSFAEQSVAAFEKGLSDTASITESLQITTSSLASSVLNASALNSVPLNN